MLDKDMQGDHGDDKLEDDPTSEIMMIYHINRRYGGAGERVRIGLLLRQVNAMFVAAELQR